MKKVKLIVPALLVLLVLFAVSLNSKASGERSYSGVVEADSVRISAEVPGVVAELTVKEGQKVEVDDVIVSLDTESTSIEKEKIEGLIRIGELRFERMKEGARSLEIEGAENEVNAMKSQVRSAEETYEQARETHEDHAVLFEAGAISETAYRRAETEFMKASVNLEAAIERKKKSQAAYGLLLEGADEKSLAIAYEELQLKRSELKSIDLQLEKASIKAPFDGVVRECFVEEGEFVLRGSRVAVLDRETYHVKFFIPEKDLDKMDVGDEIAVGFNKQLLSARITYISGSGEFTPKNIESSESKEEIVFRARADLVESPDWIKPGMFVDVSFRGEES